MHDLIASLDKDALPFQMGATAGGLIERLFVNAQTICMRMSSNNVEGKILATHDGATFLYQRTIRSESKYLICNKIEIVDEFGFRCEILQIVMRNDPSKVTYYVAGSDKAFVMYLLVGIVETDGNCFSVFPS